MTVSSSKFDRDKPTINMSLLNHVADFKRPFLRLIDGLVYSGPALACSQSPFSIVSELSGQLDVVVVGDSTVPGGRERLDQLAFECRVSL